MVYRFVFLMSWLSASVMLCHGDAVAQPKRPTPAPKPAANSSDEDTIRAQANEFAEAFAKGDAKAIAASWTEQAEYRSDDVELHGRAAIEAAFSKFFSEHAGAKIQFHIDSIRFPAKDLAIEEGLSIQTNPGAELPTSTRYLVIHVRENGGWKTAIGREWGAEADKLEDLSWLIGDWSADRQGEGTRISYKWSSSKSAIEGDVQVVKDGKPLRSGRQHILRDPQTGQLRSWLFDEDGGRGETVWTRDGDRWLLQATGVLADGTQTSALHVLTRLSEHEYLFISKNRTADDAPLPDIAPVKLTRAAAAK